MNNRKKSVIWNHYFILMHSISFIFQPFRSEFCQWSRRQRNSSKIPVEISTGIIIINYFFPYYFCCILQQKDTEDEGNNPVNNEYFVQIYKFSRILYCSKDPTTDCKTTNPNFNKLFDQLEPILQVLSVSLLSLFSSQTNWLKNLWKSNIQNTDM